MSLPSGISLSDIGEGVATLLHQLVERAAHRSRANHARIHFLRNVSVLRYAPILELRDKPLAVLPFESGEVLGNNCRHRDLLDDGPNQERLASHRPGARR